MSRQLSVGDAPLSQEQRDDRRQPVWDLPIRLVHWLLVALIAFSWWSAEYHHTDWHIWSGIAILTLVVFRLLWGLFGSSTARFANFVRGPAAVGRNLRGEWAGTGHSPLGALSILALYAMVAAQVGLGLINEDEDGIYAGPLAGLVATDTSERARELHEAGFNILLGLIGLHVLAILLYRVIQGKKLVGPMITGKAELAPGAEAMRPGRWWVAVLCLAAALALSRWVVAGAPPFGP